MHSINDLIEIALKEDIGYADITTDNLVDPELEGVGIAIAKENFVVAGLEIAKRVFQSLDDKVVYESGFKDGDMLEQGGTIFQVSGKLGALLKGERTALNFLQRLSGIATNVRSYVAELKNTTMRLVDTRKTTPGLRFLEKYAVRVGGAFNHRMGLYDGVLIKDNHISACGGITASVERIRSKISHLVKIEVEVSTTDEVKEALAAGADVIMLDNMNIKQIKKSIALIGGRAIVEVSGGVTRDNIVRLADIGVDLISVGALTHSARSMDISMRIEGSIKK
ncbi:MAG: carboxylating nicotinate-nucleotide diphosphorylase [Desulfobacterales bacterium]|nr:carboxylating nicotinate-nucleotide diphosphorylase [Deltaproteobacteria bacterium]NNL42136.1 carboxylating nicotinate-nucleotide diphosphorylase [Desulfobacterales bacterium]